MNKISDPVQKYFSLGVAGDSASTQFFQTSEMVRKRVELEIIIIIITKNDKFSVP